MKLVIFSVISLIGLFTLSPHLSGIDVTGCDRNTGAQSLAEGNEPCVRVFFRSNEAVTGFRIIYPEGRRANGIYIIVDYMNPVILLP